MINTDVKVGKITHYYNKIGVAVVKVSSSIMLGDKIKIVGHDNEASQIVKSMQIEGKAIEKAAPGDSIGLKVDGEVKDNDEVYKIT